MRPMRVLWPLVMALAMSVAISHGAGAEPGEQADEATLKNGGVKTDDAALLDFFRKRTLSVVGRQRLAETVLRLGDDSYRARERAEAELLVAGRVARPLLQTALKHPDLEIARRAEHCLEIIDGDSTTSLLLAATRLIASRQPAGAAEVLLDYLPCMDDDAVEDELISTLGAVGIRDGHANALLMHALKDREPARRAAAALVVGRAAPAGQRASVRALLNDADAKVRLRAAQGLIAAKEKEGVPVLIALLGELPASLLWQPEELLCRLAGEQAPQVSLGIASEAERVRCQAAWDGWWRRHGGTLDLSKVDLEQRSMGLTLVVAYDGYGGGGRVWECGPDGKSRWEITDVQGPIDAQVLRHDRVLVAEYNGGRITERDFRGKILWQHAVTGHPVYCQRLAGGNTFVASTTEILEVTPAGKTVYSYPYPQGNLSSAQKLRNGHLVYVTTAGMFVELDERGKEVRSFQADPEREWLTVEMLPGGRYLIPQQNRNKLVEYDALGKVVRELEAPQPYSAARLPNGNTVIASMNSSRLLEVDRQGKVLWNRQLQGRPFRVRRR